MPIARRAAPRWAPLLLLSLAGCGGDSPSRPPVEVVTPAPARTVIAQTAFPSLATDTWAVLQVVTSAPGVIDITVDWTYPDSWIYVYFGQTSCDSAQLYGRTCPFLVSSETQLPKPRTLTTDTLAAGTYYLVVYNVPRGHGIGSDNLESLSVVMGLTVSPSSFGAGSIRFGPAVVLPARY